MIIVFDGHDASGKTTLAELLSNKLGIKYLHALDGEFGRKIGILYKSNRLEELEVEALKYFKLLNEEYKDKDVIFDRHWISILTLLNRTKYRDEFEKPLTFVCYANLEVTEKRLEDRNDGLENEWDNKEYINRYLRAALDNECIIIDTSDSPDPEYVYKNIILKELNKRR